LNRGCRRHYACTHSLYRIDCNDLRARMDEIYTSVHVRYSHTDIRWDCTCAYTRACHWHISVCTRERGRSSQAGKTTRLWFVIYAVIVSLGGRDALENNRNINSYSVYSKKNTLFSTHFLNYAK